METETFKTAKAFFWSTVSVTPQKECVSDAHSVVYIQIKLHTTSKMGGVRGTSRSVLTGNKGSKSLTFPLLLPFFVCEFEYGNFGSDELGPVYVGYKPKKASWDLKLLLFNIMTSQLSFKTV